MIIDGHTPLVVTNTPTRLTNYSTYRITPVIRPGPYIGYKAHPGFKKREFCSDIRPGPYFFVIRPTSVCKAHLGLIYEGGGPYIRRGGPYLIPFNFRKGSYVRDLSLEVCRSVGSVPTFRSNLMDRIGNF